MVHISFGFLFFVISIMGVIFALFTLIFLLADLCFNRAELKKRSPLGLYVTSDCMYSAYSSTAYYITLSVM